MRIVPLPRKARATPPCSSKGAKTPEDRYPATPHDGAQGSSKPARQEEQSPAREIDRPERSDAADCRRKASKPGNKGPPPACPAIGSDRNSTREAQVDPRLARTESPPFLLFDQVEQFFDFVDLGRRCPLEAQQFQYQFSRRAAKRAIKQIAHHLPLGVSFCQPRAKNLRTDGFFTIKQSLLAHDLHELESCGMSDGGSAVCF